LVRRHFAADLWFAGKVDDFPLAKVTLDDDDG